MCEKEPNKCFQGVAVMTKGSMASFCAINFCLFIKWGWAHLLACPYHLMLQERFDREGILSGTYTSSTGNHSGVTPICHATATVSGNVVSGTTCTFAGTQPLIIRQCKMCTHISLITSAANRFSPSSPPPHPTIFEAKSSPTMENKPCHKFHSEATDPMSHPEQCPHWNRISQVPLFEKRGRWNAG